MKSSNFKGRELNTVYLARILRIPTNSQAQLLMQSNRLHSCIHVRNMAFGRSFPTYSFEQHRLIRVQTTK